MKQDPVEGELHYLGKLTMITWLWMSKGGLLDSVCHAGSLMES